MLRITRKTLEDYIAHLNKINKLDLDLDIHSGGYRVVAHGGSEDISPRGTAKETYTFLRGMLAGIQLSE